MGSFANALFSVLLGWLQGTAAWLWRVFTGAEAGAWFTWVLDNWLPLTLLLCLAGVIVDFLVYLIRWQPYRVWRSFFAKRDADPAEDDEDEAPAPSIRRKWVYADGSSEPAEAAEKPAPLFQTSVPAAPREEVRLDAPVRPVKRVIPAKHRRMPDGSDEYILSDVNEGKAAYNQPYYPPQWTGTAKSGPEHHDGGPA